MSCGVSPVWQWIAVVCSPGWAVVVSLLLASGWGAQQSLFAPAPMHAPDMLTHPCRSLGEANVRKGLAAAPGCVILSADYRQIELRMLAHFRWGGRLGSPRREHGRHVCAPLLLDFHHSICLHAGGACLPGHARLTSCPSAATMPPRSCRLQRR